MEFEKVKIKDIKEYEGNCKLHPEKQIDDIRNSIINFGYNDPIAIDENNVILEGHGRLKSLKQLNSDVEQEIDVIRLTDLDEGQKIAYRIAHNKFNLDSGFDTDGLGKEFNLLEDTDFFNDTGFSPKEITEIWEKEDTSELVSQDKTSVISHVCPECGYEYSEEIKKSKGRI